MSYQYLDINNFQVHKLDCFSRFMLKTERALTAWAAVPVFGSPAGAIKAGLGVVQAAVSVVAMAIFAVLRRINKKAGNSFEYSLMHFKNGLANVVRGVSETIPFVGLAIWITGKEDRKYNGLKNDVQTDKVVRYNPSLYATVGD